MPRRQPHTVIKKSAEGIGAAGAVVPNAALSPAAVVDGMIRLHRRDHVQLREAVEVLGRHVLRVLDPPAAIAAAVFFFDLRVDIENRRNSRVANGVGADLQSRRICPHHAIAHQRNRMHLVREHPAIAGWFGERLEEISRRRTERAIRIGLQRANPQVRPTKARRMPIFTWSSTCVISGAA